MGIEIKIPAVGESITEAILAEWIKQDGDTVEKDEPLLVIETDKVTLEVVAEASGVLRILVPVDETVQIGAVVGTIETKAGEAKAAPKPAKETAPPAPPKETPTPEPSPPEAPKEAPAAPPLAATDGPMMAPSVQARVTELGLDSAHIEATGPGGRITHSDITLYLEENPDSATTPPVLQSAPPAEQDPKPADRRKTMSPIRQRIAERLLEARRNTAMLTTFNEIDMGRAMAIRGQFKEKFKEKHQISLGFMSFFTKACVTALAEIPEINAFIDGKEVVYHDYCHMGIAIGSPKGLVVPVIRHCEKLSFAEIERSIMDYVGKIKNNRLELSDLEGGTFTISNGGVFGSLLSTPILNTPQSGILGMHKIEKRPVVIDDEIVIRPMMYVALSYDHRIVDGKGAVTFLKRVKELLENPERILLEV